jgi:hypothetical protein
MAARKGGVARRERLHLGGGRSLRQLYLSMPRVCLETLQEVFLLEASLTESVLLQAAWKRHLTLIVGAIKEKELRRQLLAEKRNQRKEKQR